MKTFITDIFPKLERYSNRLDELSFLTNHHWVLLNTINDKKIIYFFRSNNQLIISSNGIVEKAKWEYIGNKSILIDKKDESFLFKSGFLDNHILALNVDNSNEYAIFVNEDKYDKELNSFNKISSYLQKKYISEKSVLAVTETNSFQKSNINSTIDNYIQKIFEGAILIFVIGAIIYWLITLSEFFK